MATAASPSGDEVTTEVGPLRAFGYPRAHRQNVSAPVGNVVAHFKPDAHPG